MLKVEHKTQIKKFKDMIMQCFTLGQLTIITQCAILLSCTSTAYLLLSDITGYNASYKINILLCAAPVQIK